ncbi:MAG: serine protease [Micavibrio sp.]|nr:serine protease [Micavibrio sp.]
MISRVFLPVLAFCCFILPVSHAAAQETDRIVPQNKQQIQLSFAPVVKQTLPAVVNIYTKRVVATSALSPFAADPFFSQFFNRNMFGGRMRKHVESALGSGVIIDEQGMIVTNAHVIKGADEITVGLSDGREFEAELIIKDDASDLALLKVEAKQPLPYVSLKPSETLEVGDLVLAIGNPFGVGQTVTSGIVSAQGRSSLDINDFNFFIQTDAAINPGNSGGALVALDGGVVGINTAIYSRDGGSLGLGFAIPSEMVASVIAAAKAGQTSQNAGILRPWLGVSAQNMSSDIAESLGLDVPRGALIKALHQASPLAKAGLKVGDVVLAVNERLIRDAAEMKFRMATVPIGQSAQITYHRQGKELSASVKAIAPPDIPPRNTITLQGKHMLHGASISNLNPALAIELGADQSVEFPEGTVIVSAMKERSYAARVLSVGDIIMEINNIKIQDVKDVERALKNANGGALLLVINSGGRIQRMMLR